MLICLYSPPARIYFPSFVLVRLHFAFVPSCLIVLPCCVGKIFEFLAGNAFPSITLSNLFASFGWALPFFQLGWGKFLSCLCPSIYCCYFVFCMLQGFSVCALQLCFEPGCFVVQLWLLLLLCLPFYLCRYVPRSSSGLCCCFEDEGRPTSLLWVGWHLFPLWQVHVS